MIGPGYNTPYAYGGYQPSRPVYGYQGAYHAGYPASRPMVTPGPVRRPNQPPPQLAASDILPERLENAPEKSKDIFRETKVRYMGYINEFGEAFKRMINRRLYALSYGVSGAYALADSLSKGGNSLSAHAEKPVLDQGFHAAAGAADSGMFHLLATLTIPPKIIHLIDQNLSKTLPEKILSHRIGKFAPVAAGLSVIPFIVKPIDMAVEKFLDMTLRPLIKRPKHYNGH